MNGPCVSGCGAGGGHAHLLLGCDVVEKASCKYIVVEGELYIEVTRT